MLSSRFVCHLRHGDTCFPNDDIVLVQTFESMSVADGLHDRMKELGRRLALSLGPNTPHNFDTLGIEAIDFVMCDDADRGVILTLALPHFLYRCTASQATKM